MDRDFELVGEMGLLIMHEVAAGFSSRQQIIELAVERHQDDASESELRALARELAGSVFHRHLKSQLGWPLVTDCDRLDIAFALLAEKGIVTRHHFDCDGDEEGEDDEDIIDEMDRVIAAGHRARGYAFYHQQDTEAVVDGNGLCISFGTGSRDESEQAALRIGNEVADALRQQGLAVDWDGTWSRRISVWMDWKRRRPWTDEA